MYGIEAITANNGWDMAMTGAVIVMTGLSLLAFIISQLHRIIMFFEHGAGMLTFKNGNRKNGGKRNGGPENGVENPSDLDHALASIGNLLLFYRTVTSDLGDSFDLRALYAVFRKHDFPHPYLTIRTLKDEGYLVATREHEFTWNL